MSKPFTSAREYADYAISGAPIMNIRTGVAFEPSWAHDGNWAKYAPCEEPNPHQEGTFLWAAFEARRGYHVTCDRLEAIGESNTSAKYFVPSAIWSMDYIEATDWRIVK